MHGTVLLDAGGVLLDESEYEMETCETITGLIGKHQIGYCAAQYWQDLDESIAAFSPHNRQYVFWKYCMGKTEVFDRYWAEFRSVWDQRKHPLKLMGGIAEELATLHGHYRLVLAGQYGKALVSFLEEQHLMDLFVNRASQADFPITKPDPRYIAMICRNANTDPREAIMVGDRIDKDIIPAKQNGMASVLVLSGVYRYQKPRTPDEMPDLVLSGIPGLAQGIGRAFP